MALLRSGSRHRTITLSSALPLPLAIVRLWHDIWINAPDCRFRRRLARNRRVELVAILLLGLFTLACGLSTIGMQLVIFRALQGFAMVRLLRVWWNNTASSRCCSVDVTESET